MVRNVVPGIVLCLLAGGASAEPAASPRPAMHRVFGALATVFPASLGSEFADPARRAELQEQLDRLADAAADVAEHGNTRDPGFRGMGRVLRADTRAAATEFRQGRVDDARASVYFATQACVDCHARLPSARDFPLAHRLVDRVELADLDPEERARLYVVARRFGEALATWEALMRDPGTSPIALDVGGGLFEYLKLSIRVERDWARPREHLTSFAARADVPRYLRHRVEVWIEALDTLAKDPPEPSLAAGRRLAERAEEQSEFPGARTGVVYDLAASALLLQLVDRDPEGSSASQETAEAYFLLARIEDRMTHSYWLGETEGYLEGAVLASPGSPLAARAFDRLQEIVIQDFGGVRIEELPDFERRRLEALAATLDQGSQGRSREEDR